MLRVWTVLDEGLGNSSYLAEVGDGVALVIDPGRDPRPGSAHRELAALAGPGGRAGLPDGPVAVMCAHGERASTGASLLAAAGAEGVSALCGGPDDWAKATGESLEHG